MVVLPGPQMSIVPGICVTGVPADPAQFTRVAAGMGNVPVGLDGLYEPPSTSVTGSFPFAWKKEGVGAHVYHKLKRGAARMYKTVVQQDVYDKHVATSTTKSL